MSLMMSAALDLIIRRQKRIRFWTEPTKVTGNQLNLLAMIKHSLMIDDVAGSVLVNSLES